MSLIRNSTNTYDIHVVRRPHGYVEAYEGVSKNTWTFIITLKLLNVNR